MKCPQCNNIFNKEESICNLCDKCCNELFIEKSEIKNIELNLLQQIKQEFTEGIICVKNQSPTFDFGFDTGLEYTVSIIEKYIKERIDK